MNTAEISNLFYSTWARNEQLRQKFEQIHSQHPEVWGNNFVNLAFDLFCEKRKELPEIFSEEYLVKIEELSGILDSMIVLAEYHINSEGVVNEKTNRHAS